MKVIIGICSGCEASQNVVSFKGSLKSHIVLNYMSRCIWYHLSEVTTREFFLKENSYKLAVITMGVTGLHNSYPRVMASLEFGSNECIV